MTWKVNLPSRRDILQGVGASPLLASAAQAQPAAPALRDSALSLLDRIPAALHQGIKAGTETRPVHDHLQAWLNEIAATGAPGYIPRGRYVVGRTLIWRKAGDSQGPILFGDGSFVSILAPVGLEGPVLMFDGSSLNPYQHAIHMRLADFGIRPPEGQAGGRRTDGVALVGMLYGDVDRVSIRNLSGNGFSFPRRPDINANPDAYTSQITMRSVHVERCSGWAVHSAAAFGLNLKLEDPYFVVNRGGGVYQSGGLFFCERGTISFNGSAEAERAYSGNPRSGSEHGGGGICIALGEDGTCMMPRIVQTELDGNYGYNLWCQAAVGLVTEQVKSNSSAAAHNDGTLRPPRHFLFGFKTGAVLNYRSVNDAFRTKYLASEPATPVTLFAWDQSPGRIASPTVLNPFIPTRDQTARLTRYAPSRPDENVVIVEENRPVRETPEAMVSRIVGPASIPAAGGIVVFDRPEFDPLRLYDASRGTFTAASAGLYDIHAMISARSGSAAAMDLHIYVGDGAAASKRIRIAGGEPETLEIHATLPLAQGATVTIRAGGAGAAIEPGIARNRLTIRKLA